MPNFEFDANVVFLVLVFAAVFAAAQAGIGLVRVANVKRKVNKRLVGAFQAAGVNAVGLSGLDGRIASGRAAGLGMLEWLRSDNRRMG